jgi:hypothetical protein
MMKLLSRAFFVFLAVLIGIGAFEAFKDDGKPHGRVDTVNTGDYSPPCRNASGQDVSFESRQHKVFAQQDLKA